MTYYWNRLLIKLHLFPNVRPHMNIEVLCLLLYNQYCCRQIRICDREVRLFSSLNFKETRKVNFLESGFINQWPPIPCAISYLFFAKYHYIYLHEKFALYSLTKNFTKNKMQVFQIFASKIISNRLQCDFYRNIFTMKCSCNCIRKP